MYLPSPSIAPNCPTQPILMKDNPNGEKTGADSLNVLRTESKEQTTKYITSKECSDDGTLLEDHNGNRTQQNEFPAVVPIISTREDAAYPEGGLRAWLVVFGSLSGMLASFGFMNSSE